MIDHFSTNRNQILQSPQDVYYTIYAKAPNLRKQILISITKKDIANLLTSVFASISKSKAL
jgi:hypothetical protein